MSGVVFHNVAEGIMARHLKLSVEDARDSTSLFVPDVKNGNLMAATYVLDHLGIKNNSQWGGSYATGNPIWGNATRQTAQVAMAKTNTAMNIVPDVRGMGARDAVFLLESRGLRTTIHGCGKVKSQDIMPGTVVKKGQTCTIEME